MKRKKLYGAAKKAHERKLKRERDKRYRERNREKIRQRDKQYRARKILRQMRDDQLVDDWRDPPDEVLTLIYIGYPH